MWRDEARDEISWSAQIDTYYQNADGIDKDGFLMKICKSHPSIETSEILTFLVKRLSRVCERDGDALLVIVF